ncbi:conserved hypothetical protein [Arthrobacter sp. Hiyo8]|uniref:TRADD-N-associated membrane domain-containing protein n=1 Tax=Arthrobacter sp. Hiyo1 TaxID=1588020 RepID=UPI0006839E6F|nr:hypothetical protein [Arthrobacter sp. Hiyo1]BAS17618.1 conserved hypothetical protein [Arthrobacter sp. Hiyo8]GAP57978.1 conserved hypothetical protein [Arthrobacter sp. Hiyo1]
MSSDEDHKLPPSVDVAKVYRVVRSLAWGLALVVFIASLLGALLSNSQNLIRSVSNASTSPPVDFASTIFLVVTISAAAVAISSLFSYWQFRARQKSLKEIRALEKSFTDRPPDFEQIWALTQRRLEYYHEIAISQSRQSFISTQISTGIGFLVIIYVGWLASQSSNDIGRISAGAVGVAGGALSAYIGRTFMKAQSEASAQLQQFFLQPVEFSRLLGLERLIESLPADERATAVRQIIRSTMRTPLVPTAAKRATRKVRRNTRGGSTYPTE